MVLSVCFLLSTSFCHSVYVRVEAVGHESFVYKEEYSTARWKIKHFYLLWSSLPLREYHLLSQASVEISSYQHLSTSSKVAHAYNCGHHYIGLDLHLRPTHHILHPGLIFSLVPLL
jgi:hypothetical protein